MLWIFKLAPRSVQCSLKSSDPQHIFVWAVRIKQNFNSEVNHNSTSSLQVKKFNFNSVSKVNHNSEVNHNSTRTWGNAKRRVATFKRELEEWVFRTTDSLSSNCCKLKELVQQTVQLLDCQCRYCKWSLGHFIPVQTFVTFYLAAHMQEVLLQLGHNVIAAQIWEEMVDMCLCHR